MSQEIDLKITQERTEIEEVQSHQAETQEEIWRGEYNQEGGNAQKKNEIKTELSKSVFLTHYPISGPSPY